LPHYYIEVEGEVDSGLGGRFPSLVAHALPDGTLLQGDLADQSALLGVLTALDVLGLGIRAVGSAPLPDHRSRAVAAEDVR
jgi:hypothetical protein